MVELNSVVDISYEEKEHVEIYEDEVNEGVARIDIVVKLDNLKVD